jgi:hypothetical protein
MQGGNVTLNRPLTEFTVLGVACSTNPLIHHTTIAPLYLSSTHFASDVEGSENPASLSRHFTASRELDNVDTPLTVCARL